MNHRLDGVFWPRPAEAGTQEQPVVLLEVQMHGKPGFKHRLGAQSFRFLQLHPHVQHLAGAAATAAAGFPRWCDLAQPGGAWATG